MKLNKIASSFLGFSVICSTLLPVNNVHADGISVKLQNYIGNPTSLNVSIEGSYRVNHYNDNIRLSGVDRYEVASNVSKKGWATGANTVLIANSNAFADALSSAPLAYKLNAPILLSRKDNLTPFTKQELTRLRPKNIIIIGGSGSINSQVENEINSLNLGISIRRISGLDRYEVSQNIASELGVKGKAVISSGLTFADALSIAPYASRNGLPILLTRKDQIPTQTKAALQANQTTSTIIVGGEGSVGSNVAKQLPGVSRIGGADRYEVATNIINQLNLNSESAFVATGLTFADALTGSVLAAKENAPILLTRPTALPPTTQKVISDRYISKFTVLGGNASVSENLKNSLPNVLPLKSGLNYSIKSSGSSLSLYEGSKLVKDFGSNSFLLTPDAYGNSIIKINDVPYIGDMQFTNEAGTIQPINLNIPFEDYLKGVVPREMPALWHQEALKAQAIAARTYAYKYQNRTDINDTTSFQVYGGYQWHPNSTKAVSDTAGQMLYVNNSLIDTAPFTSSNGGQTASSMDVWPSGGGRSFLISKADPFDTFKWNLSFYKEQINTSALDLTNPGHWWWSVNESKGPDSSNQPDLENVKKWLKANAHNNGNVEFKIHHIPYVHVYPETNSSGRKLKAKIRIEYFLRENGTMQMDNSVPKLAKTFVFEQDVTMSQLRAMFGSSDIKEAMISTVTDSNGTIKIDGSGYGHGVGLSQHGAQGRATAGQNYKEILEFYYHGATVK
ncbi:SpoIID/LytB domain-containing protein [Fictibacillus sp. 26RED30]|uniref:SpoIID/LytB domain-containing protein n=1 Tax=Fictibacillus sp. 26RED30 TaxID=2745877 RepID=UPI0018CFA17D|nr:SpoIID/LytB domain-containing protein [Fictibacillus sp. 26RED30]MBH0161711.1 SpoIID/LytB domain-containing protein [Fictibacillus sp. 26RED30]